MGLLCWALWKIGGLKTIGWCSITMVYKFSAVPSGSSTSDLLPQEPVDIGRKVEAVNKWAGELKSLEAVELSPTPTWYALLWKPWCKASLIGGFHGLRTQHPWHSMAAGARASRSPLFGVSHLRIQKPTTAPSLLKENKQQQLQTNRVTNKGLGCWSLIMFDLYILSNWCQNWELVSRKFESLDVFLVVETSPVKQGWTHTISLS